MQQETIVNEEECLFISIQEGDKKAFNAFFLKYYPALCSYATQFVDFENSEEISQDVMVWLWENRKTVTIESSLISYLFKMIRNRCLTLINHNEMKNKILGLLYNHLENQFDDPNFYIVEELSERIESAIKSLPDSYRIAFEMNRFENMTYQEIANQLNISPKTVDYRIQQALKILRVKLKDYLPLLAVLLSFTQDKIVQ